MRSQWSPVPFFLAAAVISTATPSPTTPIAEESTLDRKVDATHCHRDSLDLVTGDCSEDTRARAGVALLQQKFEKAASRPRRSKRSRKRLAPFPTLSPEYAALLPQHSYEESEESEENEFDDSEPGYGLAELTS